MYYHFQGKRTVRYCTMFPAVSQTSVCESFPSFITVGECGCLVSIAKWKSRLCMVKQRTEKVLSNTVSHCQSSRFTLDLILPINKCTLPFIRHFLQKAPGRVTADRSFCLYVKVWPLEHRNSLLGNKLTLSCPRMLVQ